jgi:hypothetical protein
MAYIQVFKRVSKGRTYIRVAVTPKSPETRALLRQFQTGVKDFEKNWKATKAAQKDRAERAARAKKAKKKKAKK